MAIQGFDKTFYLNAKLAQLQSDSATAADWAGKDAAFLEARLLNGFGLTAEAHYEQYGYQEDLAPNAFFNPAEYIRAKATDMFNDPASSYLTIDEAAADFVAIWNGNVYNHYLQYGEEEGINPSNNFDVSAYLEAKLADLQAKEATAAEWAGKSVADVAAAFKASGLTALEHFTKFGQDEGLSAPAVPADEQVVVEEGENPNQGDTLSLTAGPDSLTGTNLNDTFNALTVRADGTPDTTLSAFDSIDGGAGEDTLNIYTDSGNTLNNAFPASANVQNVEIVNVFNSGAAVAGFADASNFEGVEQLWQIGAAAAVTNLQASTAAGFRNTEQATLNVAAATGASSVTVQLDNVADTDLSDGNAVALNVDGGTALDTVIVGGTIAAGTNDPATQQLALDVTAGDDVTALTVNTAVNTLLTITDGDDDVNSIDASGSTGGVEFAGDADVTNLQTGEGNDRVTLNTAFTAAITSASVSTGAGDDVITINTTNAGTRGTVTVDAGAGDDTVIVQNLAQLSTSSVIDGGEGSNTLQTNGGTLVADNYTLLNNLFTNFESLVFTTASTFDASRLSDYKSFTLEAASTVTKVADDQALIAEADLEATADGYDATDTDNIVYAGTLDITATADADVNAQAEAVNLTVNATEAAATAAILDGDVQEATININNFVGATAGDFRAASVTVATVDGADTLDALTSLTLAGNGAATVTNGVDTDLVTVDASALNTVDDEGDAATGLTYDSSNALAETITLGDGIDALTMNASSVAAMDSIINFNVAADSDDNYIGDTLEFGATGAGAFTSLGNIEAGSFQLALIDVVGNAAASDGVVFDFGGDSYVFQSANNTLEDTDALIQLVGGVDHDLLISDGLSYATV